MAGMVSPGCSVVLNTIQTIYKLVSDMRFVDKLRDDILRKMEDIESHVQKISNHSDENFIAMMKTVLKATEVRLNACHLSCLDVTQQWSSTKFFFSASNRVTLTNILAELTSINENLATQMLCALSEQSSRNMALSRKERMEIKRVAAYPSAGVYKIKDGVLKSPAALSKPVVDIEGNQMIISWEDNDNSSGSVEMYEVLLDDSTDDMIPVGPDYNKISIGPPRIEPGKIYNIQVRAINGNGPGEWSEQTIARFKTTPPNRPDAPKVVPGYNDARVFTKVPEIEESNGDPVHQIIVEYCEYDNSSKWYTRHFPVKEQPSTLTSKIRGLSPDSRYSIRVTLVNESGNSAPSEAVNVWTQIPVPGKPINVRQSSKVAKDMLKIRWDPPNIEDAGLFVQQYEVRYTKRKNEFDGIETKFIYTKKLSATAKGLASNTKYAFYVKAMNNKGEFDGSVRIEAETKSALAIAKKADSDQSGEDDESLLVEIDSRV
uniref:Fibronectin type-III domain-containing protein n=1 Tax=Amphimedon queenslandica TaxID=400682 RepID=A0A1X7TDR2_AMPQE